MTVVGPLDEVVVSSLQRRLSVTTIVQETSQLVMMIGKTMMFLALQCMVRGTGTLTEKVAVEVEGVGEVAEVAEVDVVAGVVIHVMREVVFEDKLVMKTAEHQKPKRLVSCSAFCIIPCGPVYWSLQRERMSLYVQICRMCLSLC
jgi:hypothetical protein